MSKGECRLCGREAELRLSHILPGFAFRWLRETSGSGHMRASAAPNKRIQDAVKRYWLCDSCEERFSRVETIFAEKLFYPYHHHGSVRLRYAEWLLTFCVSVLSIRERMLSVGRFELESSPGNGTTATLVLPLSDSSVESFIATHRSIIEEAKAQAIGVK